MAIEDTLARAAADIERGDAGLARHRLTSLRAQYPGDFEVRRALRDACRAALDPAQAGRWGFVLEDATAEEIAAYERSRGRHPREMVSQLSWPADAPAEGPAGQARLDRLHRDVRALPKEERAGLERQSGEDGSLGFDGVACGCVILFAYTLLLLALGAYQFQQILRGWLG
ncbi:hypothetical protein PZ938_13515 [Luteipulveratus sp. YIM 133132]|uniref:DUF6584 family protein n=1 Tax=Luteipulveratus flavus TaxID=3031728 RepID=UPI0023AFE388|nr:DUF6584 family protein [Luteipulveratus sp. YIM 133132]MDE9366626.1 hypothetical protein [Luteipulveratus sp. YIM 133132]